MSAQKGRGESNRYSSPKKHYPKSPRHKKDISSEVEEEKEETMMELRNLNFYHQNVQEEPAICTGRTGNHEEESNRTARLDLEDMMENVRQEFSDEEDPAEVMAIKKNQNRAKTERRNLNNKLSSTAKVVEELRKQEEEL